MERLTKNGTPAVIDGRLSTEIRLHAVAGLEGEDSYELSVYNKQPATMEQIKEGLKMINATFPDFTPAKTAILTQVVYEECFTAERLNDAIKYVIRTFKYKEPTIADFVSYDKCIKLYTHAECCRMVNRGECTFDDLRNYKKLPTGEMLRYKLADAYKLGLLTKKQ